MKDNENTELENATQDSTTTEQSDNQDTNEAKDSEQGEKAVDLSGFQPKQAEPQVDAKAEARDKAREGVINSWLQKVATGDKEMTDVPEWARGDVESQFTSITQQPVQNAPTLDREGLKAELKAELEFETSLKSTTEGLNQEQVNELNTKYAQLTTYGVPKAEALRLARVQLSEVKEATMPDLPSTGKKVTNVSKGNVLTVKEFDNLPNAEKKAYMAKSIAENNGEFKLN